MCLSQVRDFEKDLLFYEHFYPIDVCILLRTGQVVVLGFIVASVIIFSSVAVTSALLGSYLLVMFVVFLFIVWAVNGYYLPRWTRRLVLGVAAIIVSGGLALSLYEYFANRRSDLAIIFFSLAYWVVTLSIFASGLTRLVAFGGFHAAADFESGQVCVSLIYTILMHLLDIV